MRELCALLVLASALRLGLRQFGRTAEGTMASGLETVGRDLTQLRQDINTDDREVDRVVNAQFTLSSPALTGALDTTLAAREQELLSLQTRIDYINTVLDTVIATCPSYSSCNSCTAQTTCIWCRSTSSCIAGNSLGGVGQYCDVFEHGECSLGCEQYTVCGACVTQACLWCSSSQSCLDQTGNCAASVVRSREDENCSPQSFSGNERYEARSAVNAVDLTALQRELREDQGRLSGLQRDIASLQGEESSVSAGFNSMAAQQISSVSVDNPLAGLGQIVDSTTRNQDQETIQQLRTYGMEVATATSNSTAEYLNDSYQDVLEQENQLLTQISNNSQRVAQQATEQALALDNARAQAQSLQDQNEQLEQAAAAAALAANTTEPSTPQEEPEATVPESEAPGAAIDTGLEEGLTPEESTANSTNSEAPTADPLPPEAEVPASFLQLSLVSSAYI